MYVLEDIPLLLVPRGWCLVPDPMLVLEAEALLYRGARGQLLLGSLEESRRGIENIYINCFYLITFVRIWTGVLPCALFWS